METKLLYFYTIPVRACQVLFAADTAAQAPPLSAVGKTEFQRNFAWGNG